MYMLCLHSRTTSALVAIKWIALTKVVWVEREKERGDGAWGDCKLSSHYLYKWNPLATESLAFHTFLYTFETVGVIVGLFARQAIYF